MSEVAGNQGRNEEKLGVVLGQIDTIRARINRLALQQAVFVTIAGVVGAAAIAVASAYLLTPLAFLITAAIAGLIALIVIVIALRSAWGMRTNRARAASIADERAHMDGRLTTIAAFATTPNRPKLWPYLLEDALMHREDFAPARIEKRRLSRSIFALMSAAALALFAVGLTRVVPPHPPTIAAPPKTVTLDLRDLTIDPSGTGGSDGSQVTGDQNTMRKLGAMLARARAAAQGKDPISQMKDAANRLANRLRDKITGAPKPPPEHLKLADKGGDSNSAKDPDSDQPGQDPSAKNQSGDDSPDGSKPGDSPDSNHSTQMPGSSSDAPANQQASAGAAAQPGPADQSGKDITPSPGPDSQESANEDRNGDNDSGGASHGTGSDASGLFGKADKPATGDGSFQIAIEAHPASIGDDGGDGDRAPKVDAALNPDQYADEPLSRTAVPPADRDAIERIFDQ